MKVGREKHKRKEERGINIEREKEFARFLWQRTNLFFFFFFFYKKRGKSQNQVHNLLKDTLRTNLFYVFIFYRKNSKQRPPSTFVLFSSLCFRWFCHPLLLLFFFFSCFVSVLEFFSFLTSLLNLSYLSNFRK